MRFTKNSSRMSELLKQFEFPSFSMQIKENRMIR
jgi:hypothetical protein